MPSCCGKEMTEGEVHSGAIPQDVALIPIGILDQTGRPVVERWRLFTCVECGAKKAREVIDGSQKSDKFSFD